jgi:uncharacterized protein (TIGR00255 family)
MIKSMTGFASLTHENEQATIAVSVKTVNHRFLDLQVRLSQMIAELEPRVRQLVQQHVSRGRVDVTVSVQLRTPPAPSVELNAEFTTALVSALEAARATGLVSGPLSPGDLLRMPQALVVRDRSVELDALAASEAAAGVEAALSQALRDMDVMRSHEGDHLRTDLEARRQGLGELAERLSIAAELGRAGVEARLLERVRELRMEAPPDETLVAQEVVRIAARSDVSEEVTRLRGHLAHWQALADGPEPCGRKLDFLLQEMNREVNTIGSKADGLKVSELIISAKAELEKMREQVQNVE